MCAEKEGGRGRIRRKGERKRYFRKRVSLKKIKISVQCAFGKYAPLKNYGVHL